MHRDRRRQDYRGWTPPSQSGRTKAAVLTTEDMKGGLEGKRLAREEHEQDV